MSRAIQPIRLPEAEVQQAIARLGADGLLDVTDGEILGTGRRWQAAMMRAITTLVKSGEKNEDIRLPIAAALLDIYDSNMETEALVSLVEVMFWVEAHLAAQTVDPRSPTS